MITSASSVVEVSER